MARAPYTPQWCYTVGMARHPPDRELIDLVLDAASRGTPASEIAGLAGVNEQTIRKWVKRYGGPGAVTGARVATPALRAAYSGVPTAEDPLPPSDELQPPPEPPPGASSLEMARHAHAMSMYAAVRAQRLGNLTAAQRNMRDAANLLPTIARLEKAETGDQDCVRVPRADIQRVRADLTERIRKLLDRPLLCEHCGRALSVQLAEGDDPTEG